MTGRLVLWSCMSCVMAGFGFPAAAAELDWVRVAPSGKSVIFMFKDGGDEKNAWVKDVASSPRISVNGNETIELKEPIYRKPQENDPLHGLPYVIYPLFNKVVKQTDRVTVSAPANWLACEGGAIGALDNMPVDNYVGKSLLPAPREYTMPVGSGIGFEGWGPLVYRANLIRGPSAYSPVSFRSNGLPASVNLNLRCPIDTAGNYTLLWDGKDRLELENPSLKKTLDQCTGGSDNKRVYASTGKLDAGGLAVKFLGTDVRNLRVYPPGVKTDGTQYWHPEFLRMLRGARCLRFREPFLETDMRQFSDLRAEGEEVRTGGIRTTARIVSMEPYDNRANFFPGKNRLYLKFTTARPHGFKSGQWVTFESSAILTFTDGSSRLLSNAASWAFVLSPTEFAIGAANPALTKSPLVFKEQAVQGTASALTERGDMWLSEMVDLVNQLEGCDLWLNMPLLFDDDSMRRMAAFVGQRLAKGRKLHLEYGGHTWNWNLSWGCAHCDSIGHIDPETKDKPDRRDRWYAKRSLQVRALARDEFQKLGRPEDVLGVVEADMGNTRRIESILNYAQEAHGRFDEFALSHFSAAFSSWGTANADARGMNAGVLKRLDMDQICDFLDMAVQSRYSVDDRMRASIETLGKCRFQGKLVGCGVPTITFESMDGTPAPVIFREWINHPRTGPWLRRYLQRMQDDYGMAFVVREDPSIYTCRWNSPEGKGDGSDGLFDNRRDLKSDRCVSVLGDWYHDWINHVAKNRRD